MPELFSVIVLLYNNSEYLEECIDSIMMQDYQNIEIIVVDDESKSFDQSGIEQYIQKNKNNRIQNILVYQNIQNLGTVKSANGAINKAKGRFLKLLAADDALYDSKSLTNAAKALRQSTYGIVTGDVMKCDENLRPVGKYNKKLPEKLNELESIEVFRRLCVHNDIVAGGVFFSQQFFEQYGPFDESYRLLEDWPTWLRVVRAGCCIMYSPFYAIRYRSNGGIGTSVNPIYLADKQLALENIIIPAKKEIGYLWYVKARLSFIFINSPLVRKVYGRVFRNGK